MMEISDMETIRTDELMLGNWVIVDDQPIQVSSITNRKIGYYLDPETPQMFYAWDCELKPIPMSCDLLRYIGFKQDSSKLFVHPDTGFEVFFTKGRYLASINSVEYIISEPITYLHQLQNLYYSLERKRLKIELS